MLGIWYCTTKVLKTIKVYVFGWDITDLRSEHNVVIKYLNSKYDEFIVLMILAGFSAVFNITVCLLFGTIGQVITLVDTMLSILCTILLLNENKRFL